MENENEIVTPNDVILELSRLRRESERGIDILSKAEEKLVHSELHAEKIEAMTLLSSTGTVQERSAHAKLESADARLEAMLAKVEVNRVKTKMKHLTESMMAVMHAGKMVEIQWKTAGVGER
jgi:hypothetical protein